MNNWEEQQRQAMLKEQQTMMENMKAQFEAIKQQQAGMTSNNDQGYNVMGGGTNDYGIQKGAFTMLRDKEGNLQERFKETLDPTLAKLQSKYDVEGDMVKEWQWVIKETL